ncbi:(Glutamate--ammonia-ligase) adenylyltransferase [Pirellula staleyi DSM 6068]|uniref:(Glutamate--ammonia-ligase) adenylyltransferase n=1 Tax=Pirellula staleyi (strain ATCC 27377 / DSM 6068 / ICPB 4128) TaxID=530564 RepID=D2QZ40_PIRSD|nr:[glutamate--ammonia-ligase] adenylyltransferase [Pirellula staleyi]ADB18232.1 (Glutamate--ammonia-ligase) adenylyltransferase [Pirellula staleyi DSM 6068]
MDTSTFVRLLDEPHLAADHLAAWGIRDLHRGHQSLLELAESGLTLDLLALITDELARLLKTCEDPDQTLDALCRYMLACRSPLSLGASFERDRALLPLLIQTLSTCRQWRELLVRDTDLLDYLRLSGGKPVTRETLLGDVLAESRNFVDEKNLLSVFRRIWQRERLRISYGDLFGVMTLEQTLEQLSILAEVLLESAFDAAARRLEESRTWPRHLQGRRARLAIVALGPIAGKQLDYVGRLPLWVIHDPLPDDEASRRAGQEFFDKLTRYAVRLLTESIDGVPLYEVQLQTQAIAGSHVAAMSVESAAAWLDGLGRTWHRQSFTQARTVAGDHTLGDELLRGLMGWTYRRYLSRADETGIKALKRRIQKQADHGGRSFREVTQTRGGIRDIESVVQFLQLLSGGDHPEVREPGTLAAIHGLAASGTITGEEQAVLTECYIKLRTLRCRLQLLLESPATTLPDDAVQLGRVARMVPALASAAKSPADLVPVYQSWLTRSWGVLSKILDAAFPGESVPPPEVDLLLDPTPAEDQVRAILQPYGFRDALAAYRGLQELATEQSTFLSTRRCRHFLSLIVSRLLREIAATPDPDFTLASLTRVSQSLGAKGVLWELLNFNPPSLRLYVKLCAASPYLSTILTSNPGMIDELVDSLQMARLPRASEMRAMLADLLRGSASPLAALHGFKASQHLRIGVRDILGKSDVDATHRSLADVAETCLSTIVQIEYDRLAEKYGEPIIQGGPFDGETCRYVVVALGKLGGREPNYHSDVEVAFLYETEGQTRGPAKGRKEQRTTTSHFFSQLTQKVLKELSQSTPQGRLYSVDALLRPIHPGGGVAIAMQDFVAHFRSGAAAMWQWQALCKARPILGHADLMQATEMALHQLLIERSWTDDDAQQIRAARMRLEAGASQANLKRGIGGTLDVEFLVQMLQLKFASRSPEVLRPGTLDAIAALAACGHLSHDDAAALRHSYEFLRRVESGLRLLLTSARHDLPQQAVELKKLALLLGLSPQSLEQECRAKMAENRRRFDDFFIASETAAPPA